MRAVLVALALPLALALAAPARGEEESAAVRRVVIVLDRGSAAKATARVEIGNALRIWRSLEAQGADARLLACGVDHDGRTLLDVAPPTRAGLAGLDKDPRFAFAGATDPRGILEHVLAAPGEDPLDLVLLGPFGPAPPPDAATLADGVERWNAQAPAATRILAVRTAPAAAARLHGARGLATTGLLVVGFGAPEVTTQPFSPLGPAAGGPQPIEARVRVLADVLALEAADPAKARVLEASSDVPEDGIETTVTAGLHTVVLRRRGVDGRTATLAFRRAAGEGIHWLTEPPRPLTFRWETLAHEARLVAEDGGPATVFGALDVEADTPYVASYRLRRTRVGRAPAWHVAAAEGDLPPGLAVEIGAEVQLTPEIGESTVRATFRARAGVPLEAQGVLTLTAEGITEPLRLPFEIRVQPGQALLEAEIHTAALPQAEADELTLLRVVAANANVPAALALRATCDGGQAPWLRARLLSESGDVKSWALDEPLLLEVGTSRRLAFALAADAPARLPWPCKVTLALVEVPGVRSSGAVVLDVRRRQPRIVLAGPVPTFRLAGDTLTTDVPLVLRLDADGGDGAWLLELLSTPPTVRLRGDPPITWQAVGRGSGVWHLVPTGAWTGTKPGIFEAVEAYVEIDVLWDAGGTPGTIAVPVVIGPRWGARGFLIVALALMALLLALLVLVWMRTPPVKGTLLYSVEGLDGAVGRLDLAAVGRKLRPITADAKGKLTVAGLGTAMASVRPTRVGGMLEYVDAGGARERRLLVDGVSLRIGRHLVRYVSGQAGPRTPTPDDPAADLLGPEYDIASGRIDAIDADDDPVS